MLFSVPNLKRKRQRIQILVTHLEMFSFQRWIFLLNRLYNSVSVQLFLRINWKYYKTSQFASNNKGYNRQHTPEKSLVFLSTSAICVKIKLIPQFKKSKVWCSGWVWLVLFFKQSMWKVYAMTVSWNYTQIRVTMMQWFSFLPRTPKMKRQVSSLKMVVCGSVLTNRGLV